MKVKPMAKMFSSSSCSASVYPGPPSSRSGDQRGHRDRGREQHAVGGEQEEEKGAGQPLAGGGVFAVVPEAHEGAVDAPAEEQLGRSLDGGEEGDDAVVSLGEVLDVDPEQKEIDDLDGHLAEAIDRRVFRELANLLNEVILLRLTGAGAGIG